MDQEIIVVKFGGTSVGSIQRIGAAADSVRGLRDGGCRIIVVVSAMAGETDRLIQMGRQINAGHAPECLRELDSIVATGEQVSAALLALALQDRGVPAHSFTAHQLRIDTDGRFQRGRIRKVDSSRLLDSLDRDVVCVVAGFQGTDDYGNIVTLGRGGSDTSAVALAIAVSASRCEFYKDVDGIFTADPKLVSSAQKVDEITCEEMLELTSTGAKVLQMRSVELAMKHGLVLRVRSSFHDVSGTLIKPMNENMEEPVVSGLSHDMGQAKVGIHGLPGTPDSLSKALAPLAADDISVDFVTQNVGVGGRMSVAFTLDTKLVEVALESLRRGLAGGPMSQAEIKVDRDLAKVTAVGIGMRTHAGVAHRFYSCLTTEGIPIHMALSTEIKVSCLVPSKDCPRAVQALHREFFEGTESASHSQTQAAR